MNQAEQMTLRYNYMMQATSDAHGDFGRTMGSVANQQKLLSENFIQLSGKIMTSALPAVASMMAGLNGMMGSMDTEALGGFVKSIADLVVQMMPIAMQLLPIISDAVMALLPPLLEIIKLILPPLTEFFKLLVSMASTTLTNVATIVGKIAGYFGGSEGGSTSTPAPNSAGESFPMLALGGFADQPSICGEAGLEAAIPIKPGNPRSLQLLNLTAKLLGVKPGNYTETANQNRLTQNTYLSAINSKPTNAFDNALSGVSLFSHTTGLLRGRRDSRPVINYAPVINGGNKKEIEPLLRQHAMDLEAMFEARENTKMRLAFD